MAGGADVRSLITEAVTSLVKGDDPALAAQAARPPKAAKPFIDDLLSQVDTYRDAALTVLAFPVAAGEPMDLTTAKVPGARGVAQHVAGLLADLDIPGRKDALQTLAKGAPNYMGRERAAWNDLLAWASKQRSVAPIRAAWLYLAAGMAATARSIPALPPIDTGRLTFAAMAGLCDELLDTPSNGAHEQFLFAALLHAYVEQLGVRTNERVSTKSLNASDASTSSAGDVQHMAGGQVIEAYEVTGNDWRTKVAQAMEALPTHDLARVHIVASALGVAGADVAAALPAPTADVSVLDLRHEVRSLLHRLLKPARRSALERLHEHLVHRQPRDDLVVSYVNALTRRGLTERR